MKCAMRLVCLTLSVAVSGRFLPTVEASTYTWDGNGASPPSGDFGTDNNWNPNTAPGGIDRNYTAVFNLDAQTKPYIVSFPGSGFGGMNAVNYATDRLLVGSTNTVSFAQVNAFSTYTVNNTTTAEAGRGIIIGQVSGDNATLNAALTGVTGLSGVAATIGDAAGAIGTLNVSGSKFNLSGASATDDELIIGNRGTGTLNVTAGGAVNLTGTSGSAILGNYTGSSGTATVSGAGSTWNRNSYFDLIVGLSGTGVLSITGGGAVLSSNNTIGYLAGSTGTVTVDGAASTWTTLQVDLGLEGTGTMTIKNGGQVTSAGGSIAPFTGSTGVGMVTVDGAGSKVDHY
jgi:T5SS/PEP-CTERM-associated repeat protein